MLTVKLVSVGKMKERHYIAAFEEYRKRLGAYCRFESEELPEQRLPENPSQKEIDDALKKECALIQKRIPPRAVLVAMCVEGEGKTSPELADLIQSWAGAGSSTLCFVTGGSFGLSGELKRQARLRLSMSKMTFPHHLARVMLCEQLYRAFTIIEGSRYHK
ncbi:MAG: 23S rRNA (pseudouridine(1915)-N(3))-methyltransferase RlmH [Butyricicoccus sp.]|nr:23S rRNA (pseudouridine(1915)-N(3))-methyltransferase RlmH [Butyricicoccus sp.]